jgi:MurNAc alpha-1-phosphate uridylyltransferase
MTHYSTNATTAVLLAAGHGKRMLPLTADIPKPLLKVNGLSLIEYHLASLQKAGFKQVVINIAHLGDQIEEQLGDGKDYGLNIKYSDERQTGALETAGGIRNALPLIQSDPFIVVNSDIWTDFKYDTLLAPLTCDARLVMVDNPDHNSTGDFSISGTSSLVEKQAGESQSHTFSGIALYRKRLFEGMDSNVRGLAPIFMNLINEKNIEGITHQGVWRDIGTPERLAALKCEFSGSNQAAESGSN